MMKKLKSILSLNPASITISTIIFVLILFFMGIPILDMVELKSFDLRFLSRGIEQPSPEIVMAVLDEKSLDTEGRWPWPRVKIARLIDALSQDEVKGISFDIGFFEPDENTNLQFIENFDQAVKAIRVKDDALEKFIEESKVRADNDLTLANSIRDSKAKIILGYFFHMSQSGLEYQIDQKEMENQLRRINNSKYPLIVYEQQGTDIDPFITAYAPEGNLEILAQAAESTGYFNMFPDRDGVVRKMPLIIKCGQENFAPLSVGTIWEYLDRPQLTIKVAPYGVEGIKMGKRLIPTDEEGQVLINYLGPAKTFSHYSISDILHGKLPKGTFKNKIVLVGATAIGIYDMRNTPFDSVFPGLEIHATVMDNVLKNNFIHRPKWTKLIDAVIILIWGFLTGLLIPRLGALKGMLFAVGLFVIHIVIGRLFFIQFDLWINIVYPLLALVLVYTFLTIYHYMTEERERKKIRGAFSYYVSSSVVNEMLKSPEKLKLGGDKKDASVLFSDIRGFTSISEGLTPEALVHLLNEYLTVMTDIVFKYDGTLDKYIGDALMAVFGAPLDQPDHPSKACHSALEMMGSLKKLNEKWIQEEKQPLDIGIGINSGMMMVGNMGSDQRFDYTAMGDAVNLSSRLEGANKNYKTNILISDSTYQRVKDEFTCMELDSVRVKGKKQTVRIFQLVGDKGIPTDQREAIRYFHRGLQHYKQQEWDNAIDVFQTVTAMTKNIPAAELYIQRSLDLKANPPGPEWDGVFTMKTK